jgi:hypothetical protein
MIVLIIPWEFDSRNQTVQAYVHKMDIKIAKRYLEMRTFQPCLITRGYKRLKSLMASPLVISRWPSLRAPSSAMPHGFVGSLASGQWHFRALVSRRVAPNGRRMTVPVAYCETECSGFAAIASFEPKTWCFNIQSKRCYHVQCWHSKTNLLR